MRAIILAIGDELALGQTVDTNSAWTSARLAELGVPTLKHTTVADELGPITRAIDAATRDADLVVISGGLGPTEDDLTRQALADALNKPLVEDAEALTALRRWFDDRGRPMPDRNRDQATLPEGTTPIPNPRGTAPGIRATLHDADVFCVPGVPREMRGMVDDAVIPHARQRLDAAGIARVILTTKVNTFGAGESHVAELLGPQLMHRDRNPKVGTTVAGGICSIRIRSEFPNADEAQRELDDTLTQIHDRLGHLAFGRDDDTLQQATITALIDRGVTVATAESCTGGMVASLLTDVPGSSAAVRGGWVVYANTLKQSQLGVAADTLAAHGAVSPQVADQLATNALTKADADLAVSLTGIAGPGGGTPDKPVGTVYLGLAQRDRPTAVLLLNLIGDRYAVRSRAAKCALQALRLTALGQPLDTLQWGQPVTPATAT
ncbi:MAG: competence/damage-inducible protein A [Planctomycetota bacterium]